MGEHAVLHGYPCIVAAVDKRIAVTVSPREDKKIFLSSDEMGEFITSLSDIKTVSIPQEWLFVLTAILSVSPQFGFNMHIQSDFSSAIGFGSSSAVTVATLGALLGSASQEELFDRAYEIVYTAQGKKGSGADIAASVFGGISFYKNGKKIETLHGECNITTVYAGYKTPTPKVISIVAEQQKQNPALHERIYADMGNLSEQAWDCLKQKDQENLGLLFNQNHALLQQLGVSDDTLDDIFSKLNQNKNIYGAKISGSGLGDCVIGLGVCDTVGMYETMVVSIANQGVRFEPL